MKAIKKRQYASSQEMFEGSKKEVLAFIRNEALTMREQSRQTIKGYKPTVHALHGAQKQISKLVNIASFKINQMNINNLIDLLNAHGLSNYTIELSDNLLTPTDLINWRKVSTALSGNPESIRSTYLDDEKRQKYKVEVQQIVNFAENWLESISEQP